MSKNNNSLENRRDNIFEAKNSIPESSQKKEKSNLMNVPYQALEKITVNAFIPSLPTIQKPRSIHYSQRKKSEYFSHSFFKNQNPKISLFKKKQSSTKSHRKKTRGNFQRSYAEYLLSKQGESRNIEIKSKIKKFQNKSSYSKMSSLKSLDRGSKRKDQSPSHMSTFKKDHHMQKSRSSSMPKRPRNAKSNFSKHNLNNANNLNFYENTRTEAREFFSELGISAFKSSRAVNNISVISNTIAENEHLTPTEGDLKESKLDLYIKPFVKDIVSEGEKLINSIDLLLKEKKNLTKRTFNLIYNEKSEMERLVREARRVFNRGKFMGLSIWIPKLITLIQANIHDQSEKILKDKKLNSKFLHMMRGLDKDEMEAFRSSNVYKKADILYNEIMKMRSDVLIEKKKYQEKIININEAFSDVMESKDTHAIINQYKELKDNSEKEIQDLRFKVNEMEKIISRIDHERRAFRDENEFYEGENERLKEENISLKAKTLNLEETLAEVSRQRDQYFNVAMMQNADFESEKKRTHDKQMRYYQLRQEYGDLKHELTLLMKERQAITAANREESFKKEEILVGLARKMIPGKTATLQLKQKAGLRTTEKNNMMFSQDPHLMKPSYFNLISFKYLFFSWFY